MIVEIDHGRKDSPITFQPDDVVTESFQEITFQIVCRAKRCEMGIKLLILIHLAVLWYGTAFDLYPWGQYNFQEHTEDLLDLLLIPL